MHLFINVQNFFAKIANQGIRPLSKYHLLQFPIQTLHQLRITVSSILTGAVVLLPEIKTTNKNHKMKSQSETSKLFRTRKLKMLNIFIMCITFLISSNAFPQHALLKRKYMKGYFLEKNSKGINKVKNESYNNIASISKNISSKPDEKSIINKNDTITAFKKEDILKDLYLGEMVSENKEINAKNKKKLLFATVSDSKHNTIQPDTVLYASISSSAVVIKKTFAIPVAIDKRIEKRAAPKIVNKPEGGCFDILATIGSVILTALLIGGLAYLAEMFPIAAAIIVLIGAIVLVVYILKGLDSFFTSMIFPD